MFNFSFVFLLFDLQLCVLSFPCDYTLDITISLRDLTLCSVLEAGNTDIIKETFEIHLGPTERVESLPENESATTNEQSSSNLAEFDTSTSPQTKIDCPILLNLPE